MAPVVSYISIEFSCKGGLINVLLESWYILFSIGHQGHFQTTTKIGNTLIMTLITLQAELKALRGEKTMSPDQALGEIKERTNYVAEQLSSATKTAETSLK